MMYVKYSDDYCMIINVLWYMWWWGLDVLCVHWSWR